LALISLRTPFYAQAIIMVFPILLAFSLTEPTKHHHQKKKASLKEVVGIVKFSLHHHKEVKWLILYSGVVGASTLTLVWFIQPYLILTGLPLAFFGLFWALLNLSVGVFSLTSHVYEKKLGRKKSLVSLILLVFLGYFLLAIFPSIWTIIVLFIFYFVRGISGPVFNDYINKIISSDMRATVLSVKSLMVRLIFSIIGPFIGYLADVFTLPTALLAAGVIFAVIGGTSLFFLHKHRVL